MGPIDEAALDRLSLVTQLTRHIRVRASEVGDEDARELGGFTPAFLWLLRDFYFDLSGGGGGGSSGGGGGGGNGGGGAREYLETALAPAEGGGPGVAAKNQVRVCLLV